MVDFKMRERKHWYISQESKTLRHVQVLLSEAQNVCDLPITKHPDKCTYLGIGETKAQVY